MRLIHICCSEWCQVKGLLRERKVDLLVDPDLKQNYDQKEVEEHVPSRHHALYCSAVMSTYLDCKSDIVKRFCWRCSYLEQAQLY
jgi:hypothetical protein